MHASLFKEFSHLFQSNFDCLYNCCWRLFIVLVVAIFSVHLRLFFRCYDFLKGIVEWVVDLFLEIYQWVTEAFEDIVEYMGTIFDFVESLPEQIEEFFVSAFGDIEQVISSLNPKAAAEGFGETVKESFGSLYDWLKDKLTSISFFFHH
jgi:phage-related protein